MSDSTDTERLNLRLVRRHYDQFSSRDVDGLIEGVTEDVEISIADEQGSVNAEPVCGREGARAFFETILAAVAHSTVEIDEIQAEGDQVIVSLHLGGTLREVGRTGAIPAVHLFTFKDDLIARVQTHRPRWDHYGLPDIDGFA